MKRRKGKRTTKGVTLSALAEAALEFDFALLTKLPDLLSIVL